MVFLASSCSEREDLAPVEELTHWKAVGLNHKTHRVSAGETLFAIAFRYDQDYHQLAALNNISPPYTVRVGQVIRLRPAATYVPPRYKPTPQRNYSRPRFTPKYNYPETSFKGNGRWMWPAQGRVVSNFYPAQGKKGIDIAGQKGDKIRSSASGIVAYAGNGIAGYGNLIIIKHDNRYLTAYGNNARLLVKEGQKIKAGQIIAEMGIVDRKYWGVHFEIRNAGQPVNPLNYLQKG
ncbi:lipoprotein NlpD (plasmid) [Legionella adelaidensis]|uniref:Lipoprotein NlpD n=1 Tax=Legionella adelaidensis TaxID=45056 RepID=A0A0W0R265_9GAMM|nr:membrane protein [Legionella adelaidensis]VEH85068.1 lipoprotein NlpD [Legionella adelaidensis]